MACGTPVITVKNNGLNEIIDHKKNGYILNKFTDVSYLIPSNGHLKVKIKFSFIRALRKIFPS